MTSKWQFLFALASFLFLLFIYKTYWTSTDVPITEKRVRDSKTPQSQSMASSNQRCSPPFPCTAIDGSESTKATTICTGATKKNIFFRQSRPAEHVNTNSAATAIVLLHGVRFTSKTWLDLGTLHRLACLGYEAFAFDIPGYGMSPDADINVSTFLSDLVEEFQWNRLVIVSPSMSGKYSLPYVLSADPARLVGYVPIAPVVDEGYVKGLRGIKVKVFHIRGEYDERLGRASAQVLSRVPGYEEHVIKGGGHACYLDSPDEFHEVVVKFLEGLPRKI
eukprot:m.96619 g.96619  ORF g.96619 m.96619 type:complete len:277 (+) comp36915_c0_seq1:116-946(+)